LGEFFGDVDGFDVLFGHGKKVMPRGGVYTWMKFIALV
jgi:hypothetical protein